MPLYFFLYLKSHDDDVGVTFSQVLASHGSIRDVSSPLAECQSLLGAPFQGF